MKLIVGLGNPGKQYEKTRHNSGFIAIDFLAVNEGLSFKEKFNGLYTEYIKNGEKIILLKPQKYMNLSGEVVKEFVNYYNLQKEDILIIYDDVNFEIGNYKIKRGGSSGGHNGVENIINNLNSNDIYRIKIGISKNNIKLKNYVLGKFSIEEFKKFEKMLPTIKDIINDFSFMSIDKLMCKYNHGVKDENESL